MIAGVMMGIISATVHGDGSKQLPLQKE